MRPRDFAPHLIRVSSGVPGLDRVLDGGFFTGGVYIVEGAPGAGKTVLSNQIAFHHVRDGGRALYVTLLAESHTRLLQHLQGMTFFDGAVIPDRLTYLSGFRSLEEGGLKGLLDLVRKELVGRSPSMVILDGFAAAGESAASDQEFKKFVNELQVHAGFATCTFFLLSSGLTDAGSVQPVHTMVDGLVRLADRACGVCAQRELEVQKLRGSRQLRGVHSFDISNEGVRVHPRLESFSPHLADDTTEDRTDTGIEELDVMLGGGLRVGSTTMVLGPTGIGKSLLGYSFLSRSNMEERGLLFSFYETPKAAIAKARRVGLDLLLPFEQGRLEVAWHTPVEAALDVIGGRILEAVERGSVRRLFVDGFNVFQSSATYPERVGHFFGALRRELHARGVTAVYAAELDTILMPQIERPVLGVAPFVDNMILMRYREEGDQLKRVLSVLKTRDSAFDPGIRTFTITERGIAIDGIGVLPASPSGASLRRKSARVAAGTKGPKPKERSRRRRQ